VNATKERQAWCCLQVKLCDPCPSALDVPWCEKALYKYSSFPFPAYCKPWRRPACCSSFYGRVFYGRTLFLILRREVTGPSYTHTPAHTRRHYRPVHSNTIVTAAERKVYACYRLVARNTCTRQAVTRISYSRNRTKKRPRTGLDGSRPTRSRPGHAFK